MNAMTDITMRAHANTAASRAGAVSLSVLVPFYRDDPRALLNALAPLVRRAGDAEIVLHDDGEPDAALNDAVCAHIGTLDIPVRLLTSLRNRGRAAGRNLLADQARGAWLPCHAPATSTMPPAARSSVPRPFARPTSWFAPR